jgi:sphinganine-1-phosphate aldolase
MARQIDSNTIALVGSAPNFASGIMDDLDSMGQLASQHGIGLHVDCCLGGFVVCFANRALQAMKVTTHSIP